MSVEDYKGVKVTMTPTVDSSPGGTEEYAAANNIDVQNGHLIVKNYRDAVAIYAPGKWTSAVVSLDESPAPAMAAGSTQYNVIE